MDPLINNEALINLLGDLGVDPSFSSHSLRSLAAADSKYLKDLKLNVSSMLRSSNMSRKEAMLLALAVVVNERSEALTNAFENLAQKEGASVEEIAETHACASLMSLNNVFYRFRHYMPEVEYY